MQNYWLKYTLQLPQELEEIFSYEMMESSYTLGWIEPQVEVIVTENGYDYEEKMEQPMTAFIFEEITESEEIHKDKMTQYLSRWEGKIKVVNVEKVKEENESWKEEFQTVQVGDWVIAPSWEEGEEVQSVDQIMYIDPGAAFGTGYHGTTQDIMLFLQQMNLEGKTVLDVGAGSGILSVFCLLNGAATPVYAVDINPESCYEIKNNLARNQLAEDCITLRIGDAATDEQLMSLEQFFDFTFINIGGDEDIAMLPLVLRTFKPGGTLILSGIVEWILPKVEEAYREAGFIVQDKRQSDEWVTLLMNRVN
ncbi:50S ribosomal protein L11 methyltransferase [Brevibacillus daliensis]|uniref:50S ribosomal protein L11 methyltransferase n=1 Tax=Brevibacillus daliensis TaxID=2892995 RepID=UPI001E34FEA6|nr:50S ribosomal protein L11 methyltransferase [Brevibacillus daliensis]